MGLIDQLATAKALFPQLFRVPGQLLLIAFHPGASPLLQACILLDARHVRRVGPLFQLTQERPAYRGRVEAQDQAPGQVRLYPVQALADSLGGALVGVHVARPQHGTEEIARLRRAQEQGMVSGGVEVAVVCHPRLVPVHRHRQGIQVDGQLFVSRPSFEQLATRPGAAQHRFLQHLAVIGRGGLLEQARQRRLTGQSLRAVSVRGAQRRLPFAIADRQAQDRIFAQRVGVVGVGPALRQQQNLRAQQLRQRVRDLVLSTQVLKVGDDPVQDLAVIEQLPQHQRTGVAAEVSGAGFDVDGAVERRLNRPALLELGMGR